MTQDTHTRLPLVPMGMIAIVLSLVGVSRHVSADGVDWPRAVPSVVTLVSPIWFVWVMRPSAVAARPMPSLSSARYARYAVTVALGALATWFAWVTFRDPQQINLFNLLFFGVLLAGFVFFLARSFPPRRA